MKMAGSTDKTHLSDLELYERLRKFDNAIFTYKGMDETPLANFRKAAVLVPLYLKDNDIYVLLTKRSSTLRSDKGEVALPGGMKEDQDSDEADTALREAEEEIGLRPNTVRILSRLPPRVNRRKIAVFPVVALIPNDFVPETNPEEVASVFSLPLSRFLLDDENHTQGVFSMGPKAELTAMYHMFDDILGGKVFRTWGLTANILIELAVVIFRKLPDFQFDPNHSISIENPFAAQINYLKKMHYIPGNKL